MFARLGTFEVRRSITTAILIVLLSGTALGRGRPGNTAGGPATDSSHKLNKAAVPDAKSQEKANKLLREIYKDKFEGATSAEARKRLARELLNKASEMTDDPPSCYVLLREAGSLAFKSRDYELSLDVINALDKHFDVDALSLRIKIMAAEEANTETTCGDRCMLGFQLMAEAVAKGRLEVAIQMGELAQKAAEQSHDPVLIKCVGDYKARLEKSLHEKKTETDLLTRLETAPADPEANLALGKLYCFEREDWDKGIPMLALGNNPELKRLAEKERQKPSDSVGLLDMGDGWRELAQQNVTQEKAALLARAAYWYRLAEPRLSGLLKVKVEKRLAEIGASVTAPKKNGDLLGSIGGFYGRREPSLRPIALMVGGGTKESERAVQAALVWLANHQMLDGSWSLQDYTKRCKDKTCTGPCSITADSGATAMGLLPFLAAGLTHKSKGPYKEHVFKGIAWLLRHQQPDGNLAKNAQQMMYSHGLATIALSEAYGLSGDRQVGKAAQGAVNFILDAQNPADGGWRYNPRDPGDTSVVGWQLMALKSAHMAGLNVGRSGFSGTSKWLDSVADKGGTQYAYQAGQGATDTMTAVGLLCRQYLGARRDNPMLIGGTSYLMNRIPDEQGPNIYYWYYATQFMHNMSGYEWDTWNRKMRDFLIHTQLRNVDQCANGSWSPEKEAWGRYAGRVMTTSLSCLTLEIYYRYPPLYDAGDGDDKSR